MTMFKLPYKDLGGVPLAFDGARGAIMQDPQWVQKYAPTYPANAYGPADVFKGSRGEQVPYDEALAYALHVAVGPASGTPTRSAQGTAETTTYNQDAKTGESLGRGVGSATETTLDQLGKLFTSRFQPENPSSPPVWMVGAAVFGVVAVVRNLRGSGRRR